MEIAGIIISLLGLLVTVFNRTNRYLREIRDTLLEIRDGLESDRRTK